MATRHFQGPADPRRPALGWRWPRTRVERSSPGSGRLPAPASRISAEEWAALRRLADAHASVVARWPVGRVVAQGLIRRGLVHGCSEWVWLTEPGRQALDTEQHGPPSSQQRASARRPAAGIQSGQKLLGALRGQAGPFRPVRPVAAVLLVLLAWSAVGRPTLGARRLFGPVPPVPPGCGGSARPASVVGRWAPDPGRPAAVRARLGGASGPPVSPRLRRAPVSSAAAGPG